MGNLTLGVACLFAQASRKRIKVYRKLCVIAFAVLSLILLAIGCAPEKQLAEDEPVEPLKIGVMSTEPVM